MDTWKYAYVSIGVSMVAKNPSKPADGTTQGPVVGWIQDANGVRMLPLGPSAVGYLDTFGGEGWILTPNGESSESQSSPVFRMVDKLVPGIYTLRVSSFWARRPGLPTVA